LGLRSISGVDSAFSFAGGAALFGGLFCFCGWGWDGAFVLFPAGLALVVHLYFTPCRGRLTFFVLPKKVSKERRARDGERLLEFL
jgi:hypothetical protein